VRVASQGAVADTLGDVMGVMNVTTLTAQPGGWDQLVENTQKAKVILEKYGARNVRLLAPIAGAEPAGTAHSVFEADDLATLGRILDSIFADPEMLALMQSGAESATWTTSILGDLPI
jgi:hypothetical protein